MAKKRIPEHLQAWIDVKRHKLSHAHVQMARELGKLDNHHRSPAKG